MDKINISIDKKKFNIYHSSILTYDFYVFFNFPLNLAFKIIFINTKLYLRGLNNISEKKLYTHHIEPPFNSIKYAIF